MGKETLDFSTRTDAALALRAKGLSNTEIAHRLNISPNAVSGLFASRNRHPVERAEGVPSPRGAAFVAPIDVRMNLRPAAAKRGITVDRLIAEIITVVAEDGLVDAILDDTQGRA